MSMYSSVKLALLFGVLSLPGDARDLQGEAGKRHKITRHEQVSDHAEGVRETGPHGTGDVLPEALILDYGAGSSRVTPEVRATAGTMVTTIEDTMEVAVKKGHADTQQTVDDAVAELEGLTADLVKAHAAGVATESEWVQCKNNEKVYAEEYASATQVLATTKAEMKTACDAKDAAVAALAAEMSKQCNNCGIGSPELKEFRELKAEKIAELQQEQQRKATECTKLRGEEGDKDMEVSDKMMQYMVYSITCMDLSSAMMLARCDFSNKYTVKCKKLSDYEALMATLDTPNGGPHSEFDRKKKWDSSQLIKCVLAKMQEGTEIGKDVIEVCKGGISYDTDVGIIARRADAVTLYTSEKNFTCKEKNIVFNGTTYNVHQSAGSAIGVHAPEDYVKDENFKLAVMPEPRTSAFQSCEPPRGPTCRQASLTCPKTTEDIETDEPCASDPCTFTECCSTASLEAKQEAKEQKAVDEATKQDKATLEKKANTSASTLETQGMAVQQREALTAVGAVENPFLDFSWLR